MIFFILSYWHHNIILFKLLKVGYSPPKQIAIYFIESPSKMMKNAYFILKTLFVLKIFICDAFLVMLKKRLDQKDKFNFKTHDVTTWLTNNYNVCCPI